MNSGDFERFFKVLSATEWNRAAVGGIAVVGIHPAIGHRVKSFVFYNGFFGIIRLPKPVR